MRSLRRATMASAVAILTAVLGSTLVATAPTASAAESRQGLRGDWFTTTGAPDFALDELRSSVVDGAIDYASMRPIYQQRTGQQELAGVRWTGDLQVPETGEYSFAAIGDNGFRLWVDGEPLIDHWVDDWDVEQTSPTVELEAGPHDFRFELFQNDGGARVELRWTGPGIDDEIIPAGAFTLPDDFDVVTGDLAVDAAGTAITVDLGTTLSGSTVSTDALDILADGQSLPVEALTIDGTVMTVQVGVPIQRGMSVRLAYDGSGDITSDGAPLEAFDLPATNASEYRMQTQWADDVDPEAPLQEYPRPQLVRDAWQNLNGQWQFAALAEGDATPFGQELAERVTVPYPIESALSGIERYEEHFVYRRDLQVPAEWGIGDGQRLLLQFGAVDYEAWVYVNGVEVAHNVGGYAAFSADVTDALDPSGANELVVRVTDPTVGVARGKQELNPSGIFYTSSSGIWQTVWMEPVPETSVSELELTPDLATSALLVTAESAGDAPVEVVVSAEGQEVARATGATNAEIAVPIADPRLWSPDDPFLYDIAVTAGDDVLTSYSGMRSFAVDVVDGVQRITLNGEQTYLLSTLDQGYWPDGISTAPTDEALAWDIEATQDLGFNTIRKHIKVEPARWYYHADRLGMIVWQDMPADNGGNRDEASQTQYRDELMRMVDQLDSVTSIAGWVPFNEGWGEWDLETTGEIADEVGAADPSRIVIAHSGVNCCASLGDSGAGDVIDWHEYGDYGPAFPRPDETRAAVDGEHGGYSLTVPGRVWPGGSVNPYGEVATSEELTAGYVENTSRLVGAAQTYLSGSVYTQITDVEGEVNGFWTYDRAVLKVDPDQVRAINELVIALGSGDPPPQEPVGGEQGLADWSLDEGQGATSADATTFGNDLTLAGDASWTTGPDGTPALEVSGAGQATATVDELDTTGAFTIAAWVRMDALPQQYATFASGDGDTGRSTFFLQYGTPIDGFGMSFADGPRAVAEIDPELGRWYHLAGVYDPSAHTLRLYLDGELVDEVGQAGGMLADGTVALGRGQWDGEEVDLLDGALDDVRLFDRILSDDEIAALADGDSGEPGVDVVSYAGADRYETNVQASAANVEAGSPVLLASGESFADALAAGPAAAHLGASLLLTPGSRLLDATLAELDRLQPPSITIVGGAPSVSPDVEAALAARYPDAEVTRIAGDDRYETAAMLADDAFGEADLAFVASGLAFPDALSASGVASTLDGVPVLLTDPSALPSATADALQSLGVDRAVVLGTTATVSAATIASVRDEVGVATRVGGADRFATNAMLASRYLDAASTDAIVVASGGGFADALSATVVTGATGAPLLLANGTCLPSGAQGIVERVTPTAVRNVGGLPALAPDAWSTSC